MNPKTRIQEQGSLECSIFLSLLNPVCQYIINQGSQEIVIRKYPMKLMVHHHSAGSVTPHPSVKLYPYPQASTTVVPSNHKVSSPPICRSPLQGLPLSHQPYTPEPHHIVPKVWPFSCQVITCVISLNAHLQLNQNHNCNH